MYGRPFQHLILVALVAMAGCRFQLPALKPPPFDPDAAARAAMEQYDTNQDGVIHGNELQQAPSILFSIDRIDANGDDGASEEEISTMIQDKWVNAGAGVIRVQCDIRFRREPLDGATVTFEPEAFLGDVLHPATGVTRNGFAAMSVSPEHMPHPNGRGVAPGLYLVRISKIVDGEETIPAKYNTETTLGIEVAARASYMPNAVEFDLRK